MNTPFLGRTLRTADAGGSLVSENAYAAHSMLPRHAHAAAFFSLTLAGGYVERHTGRSVDYAPLSIGFHPPDEEHGVAIGNREVHCLNVEIRPEWLSQVTGGASPRFTRAVGGPLAWLAQAVRAEAIGWSPTSALVVEGLVLEMLALVAHPQPPAPDRLPPRWLAEAEEILRGTLADPPSVSALAASLGVHPTRLARTWRRFRRCTIGDAVRRLRVDAARRRLTAGQDPIVDVALDLGFADQAHFTRSFRQVTGVTPAAWRRGLRAGAASSRVPRRPSRRG